MVINRSFDPGALAGAVIAVAISSIGPKGPFEPFNLLISITLLALVLAYDLKSQRTLWQGVAFAMVCGLCAIPGVGYLLELFHEYILKQPLPWDHDSRVPHWQTIIGWVIVAVVVFVLESSRKKNAQKELD